VVDDGLYVLDGLVVVVVGFLGVVPEEGVGFFVCASTVNAKHDTNINSNNFLMMKEG
jgi:hypothetical protein